MSSTIHQHRPIHPNLWWYAVAAVLVGAVLSLMILALRPTGPAPLVTPPSGNETGNAQFHHYKTYGCFARRPGVSFGVPSCVSPVL